MNYRTLILLCVFTLLLSIIVSAGRDINCATDFSGCSGLVSYWKFNEGNGELSTSQAAGSGLVALYHFEEASGSFPDASGNGKTATPAGITYSALGRFGSGVYFDGGTGDSIHLSGTPWSGLSTGTVMSWMYIPTDVTWPNNGGYSFRYLWGTPTVSASLGFRINTDYSSWSIPNNGVAHTPITPAASTWPTGAWTQVAMTWDGGTARMYKNGVQVGSTGFSSNSGTDQNYLGQRWTGQGNNFYGYVDETAIWNRALSASDLLALYDRGKAADSKGSNIGTLYGPTNTTGRAGGALSFDGSNDYVLIPATTGLNQAQFTISMWFYTNSISRTRHVLAGQRQGCGGTSNWQLYSVANPECGANQIFFSGCTGYATPVSEWTHIAAMANGTHRLVYVNGNLVYSAAGTVSSDSLPTVIGDESCGNYFNGKIDDVTYWNRALTTNEVRQLAIIGGIPLSDSTEFTVARGTTDFASVSNLSNVSQPKLANTQGSVRWAGTVNVANQDFDSHVRIGSGYVSINKASLHATIDAPANVSVSVAGCTNLTIYYATGFRNSLAEIKANGQQCNAGTNPACTNIQCSGTTATFTVQHFDSYGGEGGGGSGPQGGGSGVPEFGSITMMLAVIGVMMGFFVIRWKNNHV